MSYKSGFYKGRLGIGLANSGGDGTGNPRFPLDVNGDIRLTGSLLRSDGTPYLGGGLINYIPKGIKSILNNDGSYYVGFGSHTPTEALDISGNLKVSGQILSVDGDNFSTVVPITQQQTTTENPTWHGNVTTTVSSSSDSASGLALKANIASPTFTSNLKIEQTGTNNNTLIINANNHNNGIDIEAFQSDSVSTKKKLCLNPYGGNVGIGTTTPDAKLHVNATSTLGIYSMGDYTDYNYILNGPRPGNSKGDGAVLYITSASYSGNDGEASTFTIRNDHGPIRLGKYNSKTTIEGNNIILNSNVGIGTDSTLTNIKLSIVGDSGGTSNLAIQNTTATTTGFLYLQMNDDGKAYLLNSTNNPLILGANNQGNQLYLNNNGNVGIGTTSPSSILHIKDTSPILTIESTNGDINGRYAYIDFKDSGGQFAWVGDGAGANKAFYIYASDGQPIALMNGNVGIGTASPSGSLSIGGNGNTGKNGVIQIVITDTEGINQDGMSIKCAENNNHIINFINSSGTQRGEIEGNGSNGVSYRTSSDRRLKENITEMMSMIDKVMSIKCREFDWIEDKTHSYGFIAQEVFELFPELRSNVSNYCDCSYNTFNIDEPIDKNGEPIYYGLDYSQFTPYIIKAFQEQNKIIQSQQATITSLQNENAELKAELAAIKAHLGI